MELTAENVNNIFTQCLAEDGEGENVVLIGGVVNNFALDKFWVNENKEDIKSMLLQLDDNFMNDGGGGWTFLNMPMRADGVQWGEQRNAEQLLVLGIACELANYLMPREMWKMFPGDMPYIAVNRKDV